jgi:putative addiction module killer protein
VTPSGAAKPECLPWLTICLLWFTHTLVPTIITSPVFERWLRGLKDRDGRTRILQRLERLATGQFGDTKILGAGIAELRIHAGPGYRIYFTRQGDTVVILLTGGDKSSQERDIRRAKEIAEEFGP